ncbi:MAG TPA: RNA-binding S4 domain-containing protein [Crocinitomicaceae bacterium]|nr:RNA-binding S4 domain-containing protein [Crocinitomicaceae bacterium]
MKGCRIDKYIWSVRLAKTRSIASKSIEKGKVRLNNGLVKPSKEVKLGDEINIIKHNSTFTFKVIQLLDKRVGAKLVKDYLLEITPQEELEKFKVYQESQRVYRDYGSGKPSKKDRRDLEDFINNWD